MWTDTHTHPVQAHTQTHAHECSDSVEGLRDNTCLWLPTILSWKMSKKEKTVRDMWQCRMSRRDAVVGAHLVCLPPPAFSSRPLSPLSWPRGRLPELSILPCCYSALQTWGWSLGGNEQTPAKTQADRRTPAGKRTYKDTNDKRNRGRKFLSITGYLVHKWADKVNETTLHLRQFIGMISVHHGLNRKKKAVINDKQITQPGNILGNTV